MNISDSRYSNSVLVAEMMETPDVVRHFDPARTASIADRIQDGQSLLFTGEGSSRIFPAKNTIRDALTEGMDIHLCAEGSRQAATYELSNTTVFCASNSGRTKEVVSLAQGLKAVGHEHLYAFTANEDTPLEKVCQETVVLSCGWENAVPATKSVVEQALCYQTILRHSQGSRNDLDLHRLADQLHAALTLHIAPEIVECAVSAPTIYFAGLNDGVAEELTLKTNEIVRKKSDFLEGTYAVHGIEEVMTPDDIVFVIDPIEDEIDKFQDVLERGVGLKVVAIADHSTRFPTIEVPQAGRFSPYVYLCTGWNLLVELGVTAGIRLDSPERARKVGNEVSGC